MDRIAKGVAAAGWRVVRFEFSYMAARRETGTRRPPDRTPVLLDTWRRVVADFGADTLVIGGKSLGGRMASMIADEAAGARAGLPRLSRSIRPAGRTGCARRIWKALETPALILQGERDPFGRADEVPCYTLSETISLAWLPDGDHSFKPRKASGHTEESNLALAVGTDLQVSGRAGGVKPAGPRRADSGAVPTDGNDSSERQRRADACPFRLFQHGGTERDIAHA